VTLSWHFLLGEFFTGNVRGIFLEGRCPEALFWEIFREGAIFTGGGIISWGIFEEDLSEVGVRITVQDYKSTCSICDTGHPVFSVYLKGYRRNQTKCVTFYYITSKVCKFHVN